MMVPEPHNELAAELWREASLRQIVHLSLGGARLRVRVSNAFGTTPLFLEGASVALAKAPGRPDIDGGSARALTFGGRAGVMIPAGAEYYSDPVALEHKAGADLAVSMYFKGEPARQTGHPGSRANSFVTRGNRLMDAAWPEAAKVEHWYMLADVEVQAPPSVGAVVAIGDSITDGNGSTTDGNDRWPDLLAARFGREGQAMGVLNAGIGGGRMLRDGLGPNLASRFDRDVIARSGVTHAIVMIGVNDLGGQHRNGDDTRDNRKKILDDLMMAHRQLVERAHAQGICVIGGTISPYMGSDYYRPNVDNEADRQAVNDWIRNSGVFDGVADFDAALRDPAQPQRLLKERDKGDGLHPSPAGFRAMADAVPLAALRQCSAAR
ncbi:SGNH/GDSL hydrolase family protein [Pseudoduganella sp. LjRoot289]|uniref:SGNH/GDSL hydrolase family protein n=1 Tax=Pseudoduganella sp. LjRoot289 TaxID=3342314 RepID=UPI003ECC1B52